MLKTLLKKQLLELTAWARVNRRTGQVRDKKGIILVSVGYSLIIAYLMGVIALSAYSIIPIMLENNLDWLYFVIMSTAGLVLGIFGSVFNTYSVLYQAKDNDLLLSMPIKPRYILVTRLLGVWFWGAVYSGAILLPVIVVYALFNFNIFLILSQFSMFIAITFLSLCLSCALGWIVAKINQRLKNKKLWTTVISLLFLAIIMVCSSSLSSILDVVIANIGGWADSLKNVFYVLYLYGTGWTGNSLSTLVSLSIVGGLFAIVWLILSHSFIKLATHSGAQVKNKYVEKTARVRSPFIALVVKECKRFLSSTTYLLNCGFGILMMIVAMVALIFAKPVLNEFVLELGNGLPILNIVPIFVVCMCLATVDITSPSVSLEGKHIWIAQSLPVNTVSVLWAKVTMQLTFSLLPTFVCSTTLAIIFCDSILVGVLAVLVNLSCAVFVAIIGLIINLLIPNLHWQSEVAVVKQSMSVGLTLLGSILFMMLVIGLSLLLSTYIPQYIALLIVVNIINLLSYSCYLWVKKRGVKIFESL